MKNKDVFKVPYERIMIARKILWMWFEFTHVNRNGSDSYDLFIRTRDHYKNKWGAEKIRLRLYWQPEYYDGNGRRL